MYRSLRGLRSVWRRNAPCRPLTALSATKPSAAVSALTAAPKRLLSSAAANAGAAAAKAARPKLTPAERNALNDKKAAEWEQHMDMIYRNGGTDRPEVFDLRDRGLRRLLLNRPKALHALTLPMIRMITHHLLGYEKNPLQFATVMQSTTGKAFCAGGDVKTLCEYSERKARGLTDPTAEDPTDTFFREEYRLNYLTSIAFKPIIPILEGITMGGGVGLSVHCPYAVATETTLFAMPETAIGFIPDVGASHVLANLPEPGLGLFLGLTGFRLKGADVVHAGIVKYYMPTNTIGMFMKRLADSQGGREMIDTTLETHCVEPEDDGLGFGLRPFLGVIGHCFGDDITAVEQIVDRLKAVASDSAYNAAQREFAQSINGALSKMSPTALKVTFKLLRGARGGGLDRALKDEFRVVQHMLHIDPAAYAEGYPPSDFVTGVNAKLIAKSSAPVEWYPATLEEVDDARVNSHFRPLRATLDIAELELPTEAEVHERPSDRSSYSDWNMSVYEPVGNRTPTLQQQLDDNMAKAIAKGQTSIVHGMPNKPLE